MPFEGGKIEGLSLARDNTLAFGLQVQDANLWAVDFLPNGSVSEPRRVTDEVVRAGRPEYSADGRVAFVSWGRGRPTSSWVMNEDGVTHQPLLPEALSTNPTWGPGNRVLYRATPRRTTSLGVGRRGDAARDRGHWNRDGGHSFSARVPRRPRAGVLDPRIQRRYERVGPVARRDDEPAACDRRCREHQLSVVVARRQVVGRRGQARGNYQRRRRLERGWRRRAADQRARPELAAFMVAERRTIAYAGLRDGVWNLFEVSRRTKVSRQLTRFTSASGYVRYPAWSPKGNRIIFERGIQSSGIWRVKLRQ